MIKVQLRARCNAAIPSSHRAFRDQYLSENYEAPKLPPPQPKNKKKGGKGKPTTDKLQKHKNNYA
jgi:hypothetical protein